MLRADENEEKIHGEWPTKAFQLSWILVTVQSGNNYINSEIYMYY